MSPNYRLYVHVTVIHSLLRNIFTVQCTGCSMYSVHIIMCTAQVVLVLIWSLSLLSGLCSEQVLEDSRYVQFCSSRAWRVSKIIFCSHSFFLKMTFYF